MSMPPIFSASPNRRFTSPSRPFGASNSTRRNNNNMTSMPSPSRTTNARTSALFDALISGALAHPLQPRSSANNARRSSTPGGGRRTSTPGGIDSRATPRSHELASINLLRQSLLETTSALEDSRRRNNELLLRNEHLAHELSQVKEDNSIMLTRHAAELSESRAAVDRANERLRFVSHREEEARAEAAHWRRRAIDHGIQSCSVPRAPALPADAEFDTSTRFSPIGGGARPQKRPYTTTTTTTTSATTTQQQQQQKSDTPASSRRSSVASSNGDGADNNNNATSKKKTDTNNNHTQKKTSSPVDADPPALDKTASADKAAAAFSNNFGLASSSKPVDAGGDVAAASDDAQQKQQQHQQQQPGDAASSMPPRTAISSTTPKITFSSPSHTLSINNNNRRSTAPSPAAQAPNVSPPRRTTSPRLSSSSRRYINDFVIADSPSRLSLPRMLSSLPRSGDRGLHTLSGLDSSWQQDASDLERDMEETKLRLRSLLSRP